VPLFYKWDKKQYAAGKEVMHPHTKSKFYWSSEEAVTGESKGSLMAGAYDGAAIAKNAWEKTFCVMTKDACESKFGEQGVIRPAKDIFKAGYTPLAPLEDPSC